MVSVVNIYNMALRHLGTGKPVANTTEASAEASACNVFYEQARDELLEMFPWNFASVIADGQLVEEEPNDLWAYAYTYFPDAALIHGVVGDRTPHRQNIIPFKVMNLAGVKVIMTDEAEAQFEYTKRVTDTTLFPASFVRALTFLLASYIAPSLPHGDAFKLRELCLELHKMAVSEAASSCGLEEVADPMPDAEAIRERGTS